jgi:alkanesulfonate monooxygenase SsuD/methylene tetrahydromethanopterin reductase-like flavin-dependent oxidoreductase (luciferase family)
VAAATVHIGLVPTVTTTHTEPFNVANRIATLDHVSRGRGGWRVQVLKQQGEIGHFGRRDLPVASGEELSAEERHAFAELRFDEAADAIEVARRLWDSWEDDAEIRDQATGRFIDRDQLHYIDFEGEYFSVRGPSITPRPPQGQPLVVVLAHVPLAYELAAKGADVVFITPHDVGEITSIIAEVRAAEVAVGRPGIPLHVFAELVVFLEERPNAARIAKDRLDDLDGAPLRSDAEIVATTPAALADLLTEWHAAGVDGFRLRPGRLPADLDAIVDRLVPELVQRGAYPARYAGGTLRSRLGFERPTNRYAASALGGEAR